MIAGARSRPERSTHVEGHSHSAGTKPDAWTSTTTSLIAGVGSGRSASVILAAFAAVFVATIAFTAPSVSRARRLDAPLRDGDSHSGLLSTTRSPSAVGGRGR